MPSIKELESWLGTGQTAKRLGYSRQGVMKLAEARKIRSVRTGAGWIYDPESVEEYARKRGLPRENAKVAG